jgi:hypothetical protein
MDTRKLTVQKPLGPQHALYREWEIVEQLDRGQQVVVGEHTGIDCLTKENADELVKRWNAHPELLAALEAICDLPADDQGDRVIPAGFLDQARAAIDNA